MQGTISSYDHKSAHGRIQAADGLMDKFAVSSLKVPEDEDYLVVGMPCEFTRGGEDDFVSELHFPNPEKFLEDNETYSAPEGLTLHPETYPEGYEIIARSAEDIFRMARRPEMAVAALREAARGYGANAILRYRVEPFKKTAMGYAFWFHRAFGTPAVIARPDPAGEQTLEALRSRLDVDGLRREGQTRRNLDRGKVAVKILAAALFLTFLAGFVYATLVGGGA